MQTQVSFAESSEAESAKSPRTPLLPTGDIQNQENKAIPQPSANKTQ